MASGNASEMSAAAEPSAPTAENDAVAAPSSAAAAPAAATSAPATAMQLRSGRCTRRISGIFKAVGSALGALLMPAQPAAAAAAALQPQPPQPQPAESSSHTEEMASFRHELTEIKQQLSGLAANFAAVQPSAAQAAATASAAAAAAAVANDDSPAEAAAAQQPAADPPPGGDQPQQGATAAAAAGAAGPEAVAAAAPAAAGEGAEAAAVGGKQKRRLEKRCKCRNELPAVEACSAFANICCESNFVPSVITSLVAEPRLCLVPGSVVHTALVLNVADYVLRLRPSLESFVLSPAQRPFADRLISANRKGFSVDCGIAASLRRGDATVHGVDYPNIPLVEGRPAGFRKNPHPPAGHAPIQAHLTASEMLDFDARGLLSIARHRGSLPVHLAAASASPGSRFLVQTTPHFSANTGLPWLRMVGSAEELRSWALIGEDEAEAAGGGGLLTLPSGCDLYCNSGIVTGGAAAAAAAAAPEQDATHGVPVPLPAQLLCPHFLNNGDATPVAAVEGVAFRLRADHGLPVIELIAPASGSEAVCLQAEFLFSVKGARVLIPQSTPPAPAAGTAASAAQAGRTLGRIHIEGVMVGRTVFAGPGLQRDSFWRYDETPLSPQRWGGDDEEVAARHSLHVHLSAGFLRLPVSAWPAAADGGDAVIHTDLTVLIRGDEVAWAGVNPGAAAAAVADAARALQCVRLGTIALKLKRVSDDEFARRAQQLMGPRGEEEGQRASSPPAAVQLSQQPSAAPPSPPNGGNVGGGAEGRGIDDAADDPPASDAAAAGSAKKKRSRPLREVARAVEDEGRQNEEAAFCDFVRPGGIKRRRTK